ncbi:DUF1398 domain-containing protein [Hufsiella ginkgonis]|uniref:DUF1398 domain-containing protein n=1 Tax=Hufsiella ginkgonis TaxID=2695274 RepID=A0A7K1XXN0_9SPHI|nr:DUF1398 family protein [Hufsiella ginkgonis]MXV15750.1 DUF1398 domain-containing protein [Hufsiella ginkgonis]
MFTLQQVKEAHGKVKTGADFPAYVREIKGLGLLTYEFRVADGSVTYFGGNRYRVTDHARYEPLTINKVASADELRHVIAIHQQGQTDFLTFCRQAAAAGVEKWTVDTGKMVCSYLDKQQRVMVAEPIPDGDYI